MTTEEYKIPDNPDPDWWKTIFDRWYLVTDSRSVCDPELTRLEVDCVCAVLNLNPLDSILDLCGGEGRHSLELARRGFSNIVVADYSEYLLGRGRASALRLGAGVGFLRSDARRAGLKSGSFSAVIIMGNSFGYFMDDSENKRILSEAFRLLAPGGRLLLDLADKEYVFANFKPRSEHAAPGGEMIIRRIRKIQGSSIVAREMVLKPGGGIIRDSAYCERLFSPDELRDMLGAQGFGEVKINPGFMDRAGLGNDFGFMTNRTLAVAKKE